jgi:glycosyltransferase involved in cell wall biosynthesis
MILKAPREPLVVTVARFGQGKGVELVPEIASLTDNNIRFLIIGLLHDLNVFQAVKRRISELKLEGRVTLITDASCEKIKESLSKAKVYLHTTKMEHFGISIVEAMSMGCLPVVHNSGGALEFVPDQYKI